MIEVFDLTLLEIVDLDMLVFTSNLLEDCRTYSKVIVIKNCRSWNICISLNKPNYLRKEVEIGFTKLVTSSCIEKEI